MKVIDLPIEIQFEIFENLCVLDVVKGFSILNRKYCSLVGRYLLMNDYVIGRYFHQVQTSSYDYMSKLKEENKDKIENELFSDDGSTFPYLIKIISDRDENLESLGNENGLNCLGKFGPNFVRMLLKCLIESIDDSIFEDGYRVSSLNFWNINFSHLNSEIVRGLLPILENMTRLNRLYLACGPFMIEYTETSSARLNVLDFTNYLKNSFSSLKELYLNGYVGSSPHEINSIVNNLPCLEKLHISFCLEFNKNNMRIDPLEAPKNLRERLTHISFVNIPPRASEMFSVIDIFETFENLTYFEYHEVEETSGVNINIKFDDYNRVIEKFSKTKLETLIYSPSKAHQRQLALASQREALIEEILENINDPDFPILFPNIKNIEVSEFEIYRECKYDPLTAVIYYILPKITSGGLLERIHAPSDCLEIATMLNCNKNTLELQLGSSSPEDSKLVHSVGYKPPKKNRTGIAKEIFSNTFERLQILTFENLGHLDSDTLLLVGQNCRNLKYLKMTNCDFVPFDNFSKNQEVTHPLFLQTIAIQSCSYLSVAHLVNLMICSCNTLEHLIMKDSYLEPKSCNLVLNRGVPVEMVKLHTLLVPKLCENVYNDLMKYISKSCRLTSLHHLDVYGTLDATVANIFESSPSITSVSLSVQDITDPYILNIINEREIKLKLLEIEKNVDIDILSSLSGKSTCCLSSLKILGSKISDNNQVSKIAKIIGNAKNTLQKVCLNFEKDLFLLPVLEALRSSRSLNVLIFSAGLLTQADFSYDQLLDFIVSCPNLSVLHFSMSPQPTSTIRSHKELMVECKKRCTSHVPNIMLPHIVFEAPSSTSNKGGCIVA